MRSQNNTKIMLTVLLEVLSKNAPYVHLSVYIPPTLLAKYFCIPTLSFIHLISTKYWTAFIHLELFKKTRLLLPGGYRVNI